MQHTITADLDTNLRVIEESVENLMMGYVRPELIVGVEFGISKLPITMEDGAIQFLSSLAKNTVYIWCRELLRRRRRGLRMGKPTIPARFSGRTARYYAGTGKSTVPARRDVGAQQRNGGLLYF